MLYNKIEKFSPDISINDKISFFISLTEKDIAYDLVNGIVGYKQNPELYLIILINNIKYGIKQHISQIKDFKVDQENEIIKKLKEQEVEIKLYKKNNDEENALNKIREDIIIYSKILSQEFDFYFEQFSNFLNAVEINFKKRFNDIENLNNKDFELFNDFCFFLAYYNFQNLSFNEISKWNNSFEQSDNYIEQTLKINSHDKINRYKIEGNDLILEIYNFKKKYIYTKIVKNIRKYSIDNIISHLSLYTYKIKHKNLGENNLNSNIKINELSISKQVINEYDLEEYLKYDSYKDIYFNKIWNIWEKHLIKIFTSKTKKSVFEKICQCKLFCKNNSFYDFLIEKDLKQIFKRTRYFKFQTNFLCRSEPHFLFDYEYYRGLIPHLGESCSKLINLSMSQVIKEHEILTHINTKLQKFISKAEVISDINKFNELSENIEILLYGRFITDMSYKEILFILDENNYDLGYEEFKIS